MFIAPCVVADVETPGVEQTRIPFDTTDHDTGVLWNVNQSCYAPTCFVGVRFPGLHCELENESVLIGDEHLACSVNTQLEELGTIDVASDESRVRSVLLIITLQSLPAFGAFGVA